MNNVRMFFMDYGQKYNFLGLFEGDKISPEAEEILRNEYFLFNRLYEEGLSRAGATRYQHTIELLNSYYYLLNGQYDNFAHLSEHAFSFGYEVISRDQFEWICSIALDLSKSERDRHFVFLLCLTHDYGTLYGNGKHFIKSGQLCGADFDKDGFSPLERKVAELLVGNHSYFGDLFLGEGSHRYGVGLYEQVKDSDYDPDRFWKLLLLLNILDINSVGQGGYLSSKKIEQFMNARDINTFINYEPKWEKERFAYLGQGDDYGEQYQGVLPSNVDEIYLQYFYNMAHKISGENLLKVFQLSGKLFGLRDENRLAHFNYITFSDDGEKEIEILNEWLVGTLEISIHDETSGNIDALQFVITDDGYLEIFLK